MSCFGVVVQARYDQNGVNRPLIAIVSLFVAFESTTLTWYHTKSLPKSTDGNIFFERLQTEYPWTSKIAFFLHHFRQYFWYSMHKSHTFLFLEYPNCFYFSREFLIQFSIYTKSWVAKSNNHKKQFSSKSKCQSSGQNVGTHRLNIQDKSINLWGPRRFHSTQCLKCLSKPPCIVHIQKYTGGHSFGTSIWDSNILFYNCIWRFPRVPKEQVPNRL